MKWQKHYFILSAAVMLMNVRFAGIKRIILWIALMV